MDVLGQFSEFARWMAAAPAAHPLRDWIAADPGRADPGSLTNVTLAAFDDIIAVLEAAAPSRLGAVRGDFQRAKTLNDVLIVRAEMVAGAKLARAGIGFVFGKRGGAPEPDIVIDDGRLGIEVKARRLDGLQDLCDDLKQALAEADRPPVQVIIQCQQRPLTIKTGRRHAIVQEMLARVGTGVGSTAVFELDQPWSATPRLSFTVRWFPQPPGTTDSSVLVEGGFELTNHLHDVESEVIAVLADPQKKAQAEAMPTILLVDSARAGLSWIRPPHIWARRLADRLPENTPFIGMAVMIPTLGNADTPMAMALRSSADSADLAAAQRLIKDLGMMTEG